jgi:hypothetical protein
MDYNNIFISQKIELDIDKIKQLADCISSDNFTINNKKVWMKNIPEYLSKLDEQIKINNDISSDVKPVISIYLEKGELWSVNISSKRKKFFKTVMISTNDIMETRKKLNLESSCSRCIIPFNEILEYYVSGNLIIFDYPGKEKNSFLTEYSEK